MAPAAGPRDRGLGQRPSPARLSAALPSASRCEIGFVHGLLAVVGSVFNPDEHAEGYSNFLYMIMIAAGFLVLPREAIWGFSTALNIACLCAALASLLVLTRVDGFVIAEITVVYLGLKGHFRPAVVAGIAGAGIMALQVGSRLAYYGYPLSNTFKGVESAPGSRG